MVNGYIEDGMKHNITDNIKCSMVKQPYKFRTTEGTVVYNYHSAHTVKNPNWKWWKMWIERFISVPAGWRAIFSIKGNIELSAKPNWHPSYDDHPKPEIKRPEVKWHD